MNNKFADKQNTIKKGWFKVSVHDGHNIITSDTTMIEGTFPTYSNNLRYYLFFVSAVSVSRNSDITLMSDMNCIIITSSIAQDISVAWYNMN